MNFRKFAALTALSLGCAGFAAADTLQPTPQNGMPVIPVPMLNPNGQQIASISGAAIPFSPGLAPSFTGSYTAAVYTDGSNVFGSGDLDFLYTFTDLTGDSIERITVGNFNGYSIEAGVLMYNPGSSISPNSVSFATNGAVAFTFQPTNIGNGQTTVGLLVETNATNFQAGSFSAQDNQTSNSLAYQPAAPTPEPASLALFGTGVLGVVGAARRRFHV